MMIEDSAIEPTHICALCRWDLDEGSFYPWDTSRRKLTCPRCGTDFNAGDVVFNYYIEKYHYEGNNPLFIGANLFWSKRSLSEKEFLRLMASYDVHEEMARYVLKELTSKRIVRKKSDIISLRKG
ncbi:MAG: hypothetical protein E4G94_05170 [ANME-2 cluster archaeon]|nr:MAG: hypothetical protein E4G94_05170 [ANME-2 cluster archaeon]